MNALEKLAELEAQSIEGHFEKIVQDNPNFRLTVNDSIFIGRRTITFFIAEDGFRFVSTQFTSEKYTFLEIEGLEVGSEYPREQYIYQNKM